MTAQMRSWLVVPADQPDKLEKVVGLDADVILLDLSCVAESGKADARALAAEFLGSRPAPRDGLPGARRWVRINPLGTAHWREDLVALMPGVPAGIMLPRATGAADITQLAAEIYELEQKTPAELNSVRIVPQVGDTPAAALAIADLVRDLHPRLAGLSWDADAMLASGGMRPFGKGVRRWPAPLGHVRASVVLAARANGLFALETPSNVTRDADIFRAVATEARAAGFDAMIARHPAQVKPIEEIFAPTDEERSRAAAIIAAFELQPEVQVVTVDRFAADRIELARAHRIVGEI